MRTDLMKDISLPQCNPQQIISQYVDDTLFTVRAEEFSVDNVVRILHNFGPASGLEIDWHKNMPYWCGGGTPLEWVKKYHWKWIAIGDISNLPSTSFGLHLELQNVDQFLLTMVKAKLKYWSSTHLSLACRNLIVNQMWMSSLWYFIVVWACLKKILWKIKALLHNYLWSSSENMAQTQMNWDDCTMPKQVRGFRFTFPDDAMRALMNKWIIQALFLD